MVKNNVGPTSDGLLALALNGGMGRLLSASIFATSAFGSVAVFDWIVL